MFVAKNGTFLDKEFLEKNISGRIVTLIEIIQSSVNFDRVVEPEIIPYVIPRAEPEVHALDHPRIPVRVVTVPHRPSRAREPPQWFENEVFIIEDDEPANYKEAMAGASSNECLESMKSEKNSMYDNQVWTLEDHPEEPSRLNANGSSNEKQMQMVLSPFINHDLS